MLLVAGQSAKVVSEVQGHSTMQALAAYVSWIKQLTAGNEAFRARIGCVFNLVPSWVQ